jgi:hypothetical protein
MFIGCVAGACCFGLCRMRMPENARNKNISFAGSAFQFTFLTFPDFIRPLP